MTTLKRRSVLLLIFTCRVLRNFTHKYLRLDSNIDAWSIQKKKLGAVF